MRADLPNGYWNDLPHHRNDWNSAQARTIELILVATVRPIGEIVL